MRRMIIGICMAAYIPATAIGAGNTAAQTVEACRLSVADPEIKSPTPDQAMYIGYCLGLMEGLRGGNFYLQQGKSEMAFCAPDNVLNEDLARTFVGAVDLKPDLRQLRASLAAQIIFSQLYPCAKT